MKKYGRYRCILIVYRCILYIHRVQLSNILVWIRSCICWNNFQYFDEKDQLEQVAESWNFCSKHIREDCSSRMDKHSEPSKLGDKCIESQIEVNPFFNRQHLFYCKGCLVPYTMHFFYRGNEEDTKILSQYNEEDTKILWQYNEEDTKILWQYNEEDTKILWQYNEENRIHSVTIQWGNTMTIHNALLSSSPKLQREVQWGKQGKLRDVRKP